MATSGLVAVVTGAASGIGRAVCKLMLSRQVSVIAVDVSGEALSKLTSEEVTLTHRLDVTKKSDIEAFYAMLEERYGSPPQVLVNSAGITRDSMMVKLTERDWDSVMDVNLKGTFLMTQTHAQRFIKAKLTAGSIVNVSSASAKGNIGQANYSASKAGVIGFTKTSALELARYGLRVNCVLPGFIDTPMTQTIPEDILNQIIKRVPLQRRGRAEEVAHLVAFLGSAESSYITGAAIDVDGGIRM